MPTIADVEGTGFFQHRQNCPSRIIDIGPDDVLNALLIHQALCAGDSNSRVLLGVQANDFDIIFLAANFKTTIFVNDFGTRQRGVFID